MIERVDEFERNGSRYTLYRGGPFTLFREDDDGATGVGTIERVPDGWECSCWWRPGAVTVRRTLPDAVAALVALSGG